MKERYTFAAGRAMKREIITTADGSSTLKVAEIDECYHSVNGALAESMHIFITNGLRYYISKNPEKSAEITILEAGFGTGLNCLLSLLEKQSDPKYTIHYISLEIYPLDKLEAEKLNYPETIKGYNISEREVRELFIKIHSAKWDSSEVIIPGFTLTKLALAIENLSDCQNIKEKYLNSKALNLVYFDAFSPEKQPELWSSSIFNGIGIIMKPGSILTTYSSKGVVKQALRDAGFNVQRIAGPAGKKHIIRAEKL